MRIALPAKKVLLILIALLFLLLLVKWIIDQTTRVEVSRGNDRFGLCFISAPDNLADETRYRGALATGARWDRWPLYWHWVDRGGYVGDHTGGSHDYDTLVRQEIAHGLIPIVILMGTPARYTANNDVVPALSQANKFSPLKEHVAPASMATTPPVGLFEPIFADGTDDVGPGQQINPANVWAGFVFYTVERYRPGGILAKQQGWSRQTGIRYWEVWNEPDYDLFWQGTVEEYYRLLEVAYKSIKAADPEATVILGGLAFYDKPDWLATLLRQAGGDPSQAYFDVLSFHHYLNIYNSERLILQTRTTLATFGLAHVPIWITESGVSVWDDYPATTYSVSADEPFRATMPEQAAYVIQHPALAFYNGVERYYHFMLHDDCGDGPSSAYGLRQNFTPHVCNPAEGKPRPAYAAYQLVAAQFQDLIPLWREKKYEQDQVAFYRPGDQSRLLAVWATQGLTVTTTISATGETAQLYWIESHTSLSGTTGLSRTLTLTPNQGVYTLTLPPATNQNAVSSNDPTYQIGGRPYLLVERDTLPPQATVNPLPPTSPPGFVVAWQGDDSGSGMASYEVWASQDDQPLQLWLADTTATQAEYTGDVGHAYGFAVRARDRAGNEAPLPTEAQATTQVIAGLAVSGVVLGPDGQPVANATVTVNGPNTHKELVTDGHGLWPPVSLPAGAYTFQASAPNYGLWPAPRRVNIEASTGLTLTLAPPTNSIASGDFERDQVWAVWDWPHGQINLSIEAFDGQAGVRLGDGVGEPITCPHTGQPGQLWTLQQQVPVPPTTAPVLSFLYTISTPQTTAVEAWLEVVLLADGQPHYLVPPGDLGQATAWRLVSLDLSAWRGQPVDLQFQVVRCSEEPFSVTLDRVSVGDPTSP